MRNKLLKAVSVIAAAIILSSSAEVFGAVLPGFTQLNYYNSSTYADVFDGEWYNNYVGFAYEYGIMTGTADGIFSPNGKLTTAEAITVAARLNATYYGNSINLSVGSDWFAPYLAYAVEQGIITYGQFSGRYFDSATREQLAYLLYRALPDCYYKINDISPIPDVSTGNPYNREILALYEAGVVTGNDEYGTFYPYSSIVRCEVAAMVSRAINSDLRVSFSLNPNIPLKPLFFSWRYPAYGNEFSLNLQISYYDYNYFNVKRRTYNYTDYATDDADVSGLSTLAYTLKSLAEENGYTSAYDIAGFITAFVQNIEYRDDMATKGVAEYPKYPIETLFEQGGDCEDKAALLAKLLKLLGYGSVLLVSKDHMAVGLQTSGRGNLSYNGAEYYYIETTEPGWRVGEVPGDMLGIGMEVLYI